MNERLTSTSDFSPVPIPVRHQPQPSLKGQFCFISSEEEDSPSGLYPFSHTKPPPPILGPSPHYYLFTVLYLSLLPLLLPMLPYPWPARTLRPGPQLWGRVLSTRQRELSPAPAFSSSEQDTGTRVTSESFCSACREDTKWGEGSKTPRPQPGPSWSQFRVAPPTLLEKVPLLRPARKA